MKLNSGNHPTLNIDLLSNKKNNSKQIQPMMSPILNSATFIDKSKIPLDWMYWETPNGNILDWGRYPDFEQYSRKDKAKYGHGKRLDCFSTKVDSQVKETAKPNFTPVCKNKAKEQTKYDYLLYNKSTYESPLSAVKMSFCLKDGIKPTLKPALKLEHQQPQRAVKRVRFADEITTPTKTTKPNQASRIKRTVLTLNNLTKHLPSIPSPHSIKFSTIMTTKVWVDKARRYLSNDPLPDYCPTPTTPEYTWFDPVSFRPVYVYEDGRQRAQLGQARIMK
jgi:hypothetical protein